MDNSKIEELELHESLEISPIKVLSHKSNRLINSSPSCTVLEVFDENKENSEVVRHSKNVKQKVFVQSRYRSNVDEKKVNTATLNSIVGAKKPQNKKSIQTLGKTSVFAMEKGSATNVQKCTDSKGSKNALKGNQETNTQTELDMDYCQYVQAFYLKSFFNNAINVQKSSFLKVYQELKNDLEKLNQTFQLITVNKTVDNIIQEREHIENVLENSLNKKYLQELLGQLEMCLNFVEVDEELDCMNIEESDLLAITGPLSQETKNGDIDVVKIFSDLNKAVLEMNNLMKTQFEDLKKLKELIKSAAYKTLDNIPNN